MKKSRQQDFFDQDVELKQYRIAHGGELAKGRRKITRPLDKKKPVHVVFKSSHAKGQYSLLSAKHKLKVDSTIRDSANKFGVKVHKLENMGNHIHSVLSFTNRTGVQNFLRTVASIIARFVTGACRGNPFGKKFWDHLVFTRVVTGRRDYQNLMNYVFKNKIERDNGAINRAVVEDYEEAERRAARRGVDVWVILDEWNNGKNRPKGYGAIRR